MTSLVKQPLATDLSKLEHHNENGSSPFEMMVQTILGDHYLWSSGLLVNIYTYFELMNYVGRVRY